MIVIVYAFLASIICLILEIKTELESKDLDSSQQDWDWYYNS